MINAKVKKFLDNNGLGDRLTEHSETIDTVEHAAQQIGCTEPEIAKTLSFIVDEKPVMILCAGDAKISNSKYKAYFHTKAKMLTPDQVHNLIGHDIGGVCPFGIKDGVTVYLEESLKRFDVVYPACGSGNSAVRLTIPELEQLSGFQDWIDVCTW